MLWWPRVEHCRLIAAALSSGALIEPVIHPKPGAVTPLWGHDDKSILDYMKQAPVIHEAIYSACMSSRKGFIASGLRVYREGLRGLGLRSNLSLGTVLLLLPLAASARVKGSPDTCTASGLVRNATGISDSIEYYATLRYLSPGHLGKYRGPLPDVYAEAEPPEFWKVLSLSSADNVHWDILNCYTLTRFALGFIEAGGLSIDSILYALLQVLANAGDTLIMRRYGVRAFKTAIVEARQAVYIADKTGNIIEAVEFLDGLWRPRGWNPGSSLDIIAAAISLYNSRRILE